MKNFSWKRFFLFSCWMFVLTLLVMVIWNYFLSEEKVAGLFTKKEIIQRVIQAVFMGFVFAVFMKPKPKEKKA